MTEEQGEKIIDLLTNILDKINDVEYNTSRGANDTDDVVNRLDDVISVLGDINMNTR